MAKKSQQPGLNYGENDTTAQGPVECLGQTFPNDEARRAHFTDLLRKKLKDPAFRKIEGFPIGEDEDILALSDPPYYTACPNPFIELFVAKYASQTTPPFVSPYSQDVKEGKGDNSYYIHSYHTKVPPTAVSRLLDYYCPTEAILLDSFSGSGMTGIASTLVEKKHIHPVLVDLATAATFISYFHSLFRPNHKQLEILKEAFESAQAEFSDFCSTLHTGWPAAQEAPKKGNPGVGRHTKENGVLKFTVWSDIVRCPECGHEMCLWDVTVNLPNNHVNSDFPCPKCSAQLTKEVKGASAKGATVVERVLEKYHDDVLRQTAQRLKRVPVLLSYDVKGVRYEKLPEEADLERITKAETQPLSSWVPIVAIPKGDKTGDPFRAGITHVHQYHSRRTLHVLAFLFDHLRQDSGLMGFVTSVLTRCSWQNRYMPQHRGNRSREVVGPLSGTLYIPPFSLEINPLEYCKEKSKEITKRLHAVKKSSAIISTQSASQLPPSLKNQVDYVFIDPPFGANLQYSELSFAMEAWLRVRTNTSSETVVNDSRHLGLHDYGEGMRRAFLAVHEALKPGRWVTIEFHNSQNAVWNVIQTAVLESGLVIADVRTLDKVKGTTKQLTQANAVKQDLIITAYRPDSKLEEKFKLAAGREEGAWEFIRGHLSQLPVFVTKADRVEVIAERQPHFLFDRMVAFHIQRGFTVPLSAAELYAGVRQRFPERDGMYFLPEQATEYDGKRLSVKAVEQYELFVSDEKTAIQWVRRQLADKAMTYQDLQPLYMREAQRVWEKHEQPLELLALLEENFIKDGSETWRMPDSKKESDLEQIRNRSLMREFQRYLDAKGKLKVVRSEALRAGFKECWQRQEYKTIVEMTKRVPDSVVQEDQALLMYFDNALMRVGE